MYAITLITEIQYITAQFKLDNETCVALELFDKFIRLLMSFTQAYDPIS